jgi:quaternary ammonium compound-resistance protein SugE
MGWIYLILAGIFETVWAVSLKFTEGFTKLFPTAILIIAMIASILFLALAIKTIQLSIAYPVWTGIGAIGTVVAGILLFDESKDMIKFLCIFLIIAGIVGLKLFTGKN